MGVKAVAILVLMTITVADLMQPQDNYTVQRYRMVRDQIRARGISDENVLAAMEKVERHLFVPPEYRNAAYGDFPLPIDEGQTISQPYIVAFMTEILHLEKNDRILEVGTGSGYQAAVLSLLCDTVYTIEIFDSLTKKAGKLFRELGYKNIVTKTGDGYAGWTEHAPYDAILVTCAPAVMPESLKAQLADGGRMIIPVGQSPSQQLVLLKKKSGKIKSERVLPVRFVPMTNGKGKTY